MEKENMEVEVTETESQEEKEGKLFTQEEVNKIVQDRLKRQEKKEASEEEKSLESRTLSLDDREKKLDCKEYLMDKNYPMEMLEIIDTTDVEEFKRKADKANAIVIQKDFKVPPLASTEEPVFTASKGFERNRKHTPRFKY